jgi:hypothetical protein
MRQRLAPVALPKLKKRPRGKSFERGNSFGAATRWKAGQSGNPNGRTSAEQKADAEISKALLTRLPEVDPRDRHGRTYTQKLADVWIELGLEGNVSALVSLAERIEGKPPVAMNISGGMDNLDLLLVEMTKMYESTPPALEGEVSGDETG